MGVRILTLTAGTLLLTPPAFGDGTAAPGAGDMRMRVSAYAADEIYRLKGYVGYQIDLQFEPGESFVGLGAGDLESLSFAAQDNHLFLKPRATAVDTNLTVCRPGCGSGRGASCRRSSRATTTAASRW